MTIDHPCRLSIHSRARTSSRTKTGSLVQSQQINQVTPDPCSKLRGRHLLHSPVILVIHTKDSLRQHLSETLRHAREATCKKTNRILTEGSKRGTCTMCSVRPWVH